jgi:hypothetical protein
MIASLIFAVLGIFAVAIAIWMFVNNAKHRLWDFVTIGCPIGLLVTAAFAFYCAIWGAPKIF